MKRFYTESINPIIHARESIDPPTKLARTRYTDEQEEYIRSICHLSTEEACAKYIQKYGAIVSRNSFCGKIFYVRRKVKKYGKNWRVGEHCG